MNKKIHEAFAKIHEAFVLLEEGINEALAMPRLEKCLNNAEIVRVTGFNKNTIAELKNTGKVKTYDKGRRAKASEVEKALEDKPIKYIKYALDRHYWKNLAKAKRTQQSNRINVVGK